jgi:hypothetical protein
MSKVADEFMLKRALDMLLDKVSNGRMYCKDLQWDEGIIAVAVKPGVTMSQEEEHKLNSLCAKAIASSFGWHDTYEDKIT